MLGHSTVGLTERYVRSSKRVESEAADNAANLAELTALYMAADTQPTLMGVEDQPAPSSPFSRVHEDIGRVDALSAHLSALREQLNDESLPAQGPMARM
jgi:hypothetical protein